MFHEHYYINIEIKIKPMQNRLKTIKWKIKTEIGMFLLHAMGNA